MTETVDVMLVHMPRYVHFSDPPIALAYLNAAAKKYGYKTTLRDYSLDFYNRVRADVDAFYPIYKEIDAWYMIHNTGSSVANPDVGQLFGNSIGQPFGEGYDASEKDDEIDISYDEMSISSRSFFECMLDDWVQDVIDVSPKVLGISLFTYHSVKITKLFLKRLRQHPEFSSVVALGGPGVSPTRKELVELSDHYIRGNGERAIVEIVDHVTGNVSDTSELDTFSLYPDYTDFDLPAYGNRGTKLRITGSRGCIRRCNFCDIYRIWPKFISRDGVDVANEMYHQHTTLPTSPKHFYFTDSLLNGDADSFRDMCRRLKEIREETGVDITWEGQFVAMSPRYMPDSDYVLMKDAGCKRVSFGIESGSEKVRLNMNKKMRQADIHNCIEKLHECGIEQVWLLIVGFPTETTYDFYETVELLELHRDLNGTMKIQLGIAEFRPDEGSDWVDDHNHDLSFDDQDRWLWAGNDQLTPEVRLRRLIQLEQTAQECGYIHRVQNDPFGRHTNTTISEMLKKV